MAERMSKADAGLVISVGSAIASAIALLRTKSPAAAAGTAGAGGIAGNTLYLDEATMNLLIAIASQCGKMDEMLVAMESCKTDEILVVLNDLLLAVKSLPSAISDPSQGGSVINRVTRMITLRAVAVPAGRGVKISDFSLVTGRITQLLVHWPSGVNGLVDVAIGHGSVWVAPASTRSQPEPYMTLDSASIVFNTDEPVLKNDQLWMVVRNRDALNPHTITSVITTIGEA